MIIRLADFLAASHDDLHRFTMQGGDVCLDDVYAADTVWPPGIPWGHWCFILWSVTRRTGVIPERVAIRILQDPDPNIVSEVVRRLHWVSPRTKALHDEFEILCIHRGTEPEIANWISSGLGAFLQEMTSPQHWFPGAFKEFVIDLTKPRDSDDEPPK
jgi:hypothetical protein